MVHGVFRSAFLALCLSLGAWPAWAQVPMRIEASMRQPDGKILVAGQGTSAGSPKRILIGRLNADGSLDVSFVSGGWLTYTADPSVSAFRATALAVAADGKIVVALVQDAYPGLLRLNADGSPDSSFGNGVPGLLVDQSADSMRINALMPFPTGDIVAIGAHAGPYTNNVLTPALARYSSNGRDPYFGQGPSGLKLPFWSITQAEGELRAAADWGNNKFVAAGYMNNGDTRWFLLARFYIWGDFDYSFANGGWTRPVDGEAVGITAEPGGNIFASGHDAHRVGMQTANNFMVAAFDTYGQPLYGFSYGGVLRSPVFIDSYWDASATAVSAARIPGSSDVVVAGTTVQSGPTVACDAAVTCAAATNTVSYPYTLPAGAAAPTATKLYNAAINTGMAGQTVDATFQLAIPASTLAGSYSSTWTYSLVSGP